MRTYLKWALPVLVIGLISYLAWGFTTKLHRKQETAERIQALPDFTAKGLDTKLICQNIFDSKSAVLVYFNPDCDHCQREADELHKHAALLANAQILLLSSASLFELKTFAQAHKLNNLPNLRVAHIDRQIAYDTFGFTSVPDVLIYHADGSLSKHFRGETSIEAIKRHL